MKILEYMPFVVTSRCFSGSEAVKSGLLLQCYRNLKRDALGIKTFRGLFTWYRNEFCSRTSSYRLPHDTRVKSIRNESFLNEFIGVFIHEFIGVFIPERNTHPCIPLILELCKRYLRYGVDVWGGGRLWQIFVFGCWPEGEGDRKWVRMLVVPFTGQKIPET